MYICICTETRHREATASPSFSRCPNFGVDGSVAAVEDVLGTLHTERASEASLSLSSPPSGPGAPTTPLMIQEAKGSHTISKNNYNKHNNSKNDDNHETAYS